MFITQEKALRIAEMHGGDAGDRAINELSRATNSIEACEAIKSGLLEAFSTVGDAIDEAIADGFAFRIADIMWRGREAIRKDPLSDSDEA